MTRPFWPLYLILFSIFLPCYLAVLTDEAGVYDFRISLLGRLKDIKLDEENDSFLAVSERGLLSRIDASSGDIVWRQAIDEQTESVVHKTKSQYALTIGKDDLFVWNKRTGALETKMDISATKGGSLYEINEGYVYLVPKSSSLTKVLFQENNATLSEVSFDFPILEILTVSEKNYVLTKDQSNHKLVQLNGNWQPVEEQILPVPANSEILGARSELLLFSYQNSVHAIHLSHPQRSHLLFTDVHLISWTRIPTEAFGYSITIDLDWSLVTCVYTFQEEEFVLVDEFLHGTDTSVSHGFHAHENRFLRTTASSQAINFDSQRILKIENSFTRSIYLFKLLQSQTKNYIIVVLEDGTIFCYSDQALLWKREEALAYAADAISLPVIPESSDSLPVASQERESMIPFLHYLRDFKQLFKIRHLFPRHRSLDAAFVTNFIIPTYTGSLYCISSDVNKKDRIVWKKDFSRDVKDVKSWLLKPAFKHQEPSVVAFVHIFDDGYTFRIIKSNDGSIIYEKSETQIPHDFYFLDNTKDHYNNLIFALHQDTVSPLGDEVSFDHFLRTRPSVIFTKVKDNILQGFRILEDHTIITEWELPFKNDEALINTVQRNPHETIASLGRVLADRKVMYKYLNPNVMAVLTRRPNVLTVYIIDTFSGTILHRNEHSDVVNFENVNAVLSENWLVYSYWNAVPTISTKIVSVELFEGDKPNVKYNFDVVESGNNNYLPSAFTKSFNFDRLINAMAVTTTNQGITSRDILVSLSSNQLGMIPQSFLSPLRPVHKHNEKPEPSSFIPYEPVLPVFDNQILSYDQRLYGIKKMISEPSTFESTTLVMAVGLDIFLTRTAPSMPFDMLSSYFDKKQLTLTTLGILLTVLITKPMVKRKQLNAKWYS
ncbi:ER membrane protein complex subunit 1 [Schizosaccharomyces cryophilus OY26]|uniref:ER membrane protein complex subunit 1 n=1 Tax=Schizosaccharomyces cryophilus (strain OY26 / ATCC MYA-4695 / CBS 11777 / NBRC 106824 / NRRL Y48691) TaxID=653667 RepID=S9W216_SCHCR|nr:ER membrane protein complex subunit 1 [Schizosaccharomyces cryophilus OY26]EPY52389.1 ER membrane protein complex subunit 1 [Schizosaccharomyces cryophilus OY26]